MNKTTVKMEITLPHGYELAEPVMRKVTQGESYLHLDTGEVCIKTKVGKTRYAYPILRKKWQPEVGKWYHFSDYENQVGTNTASLLKFTHMVGGLYAESGGHTWRYCWPVSDSVEIGK